jgi:hypothetical protein
MRDIDMKYLQSSPISALLALAMLRWRGPFRSHFGFAVLGIVLIVVLIFLVLQLAQDKPRDQGAAK